MMKKEPSKQAHQKDKGLEYVFQWLPQSPNHWLGTEEVEVEYEKVGVK